MEVKTDFNQSMYSTSNMNENKTDPDSKLKPISQDVIKGLS